MRQKVKRMAAIGLNSSPHLSLDREGRWGTTDDFTTSFLQLFPPPLETPETKAYIYIRFQHFLRQHGSTKESGISIKPIICLDANEHTQLAFSWEVRKRKKGSAVNNLPSDKDTISSPCCGLSPWRGCLIQWSLDCSSMSPVLPRRNIKACTPLSFRLAFLSMYFAYAKTKWAKTKFFLKCMHSPNLSTKFRTTYASTL